MTDTVDTIIPISKKKYINKISYLGAENKFLKEKENLYLQALKQPKKLTAQEEYNIYMKLQKEKETKEKVENLKKAEQLLKDQELEEQIYKANAQKPSNEFMEIRRNELIKIAKSQNYPIIQIVNKNRPKQHNDQQFKQDLKDFVKDF